METGRLPEFDFSKQPALPPARAVRAKCVECVGGAHSEIKHCSANACPASPHDCSIWPFRMGRGRDLSSGHPNVSRRRAIRNECLRCMGGSSKLVKECSSTRCALWPYRHGRGVDDVRGHRVKCPPTGRFRNSTVSDGDFSPESTNGVELDPELDLPDEISLQSEKAAVVSSGER